MSVKQRVGFVDGFRFGSHKDKCEMLVLRYSFGSGEGLCMRFEETQGV